MKKILRTSLDALQNMEFFQLIVDVLAYLTKKDLSTLLIDQAVADLSEKQDTYDEALVAENKLKNPEGMNEVDKMRDNYISKLYIGVKYFADKYPVAERAAAATRLLEIITRHGGVDIAYLPQARESGVLTNLEQELSAEAAAADLKTVALDDLAALLFTANNKFVNYKQVKDQAAALLTMGKTKEARSEVQAAFSALAERINALALINGEEPYTEVIDTINHTVKSHLDTAKQRAEQAKKKKEDETMEDENPE